MSQKASKPGGTLSREKGDQNSFLSQGTQSPPGDTCPLHQDPRHCPQARVRWPGAAAEPRGEGPECSGLEVTELGGTTELQPQGDIHPSEAPGTTGGCVLQESQASAMLTMPWAWAGPGPAAPVPPWEPELLLSLGAEFPAPFLLYFLSLEEATKQELR